METLIERENITSHLCLLVFICARKQSGAAPIMFSSNTHTLGVRVGGCVCAQ